MICLKRISLALYQTFQTTKMNFDFRAKKFSETKTAVRLNLLQIFEPVRYNVYFCFAQYEISEFQKLSSDFQNEAKRKTFLLNMSFYLHENFHISGLAHVLALKQRLGSTRKWTILRQFLLFEFWWNLICRNREAHILVFPYWIYIDSSSQISNHASDLFQDENTPFSPVSIRSHFLHVFIVVQVEEPNTSNTRYKVQSE